MRLIDANAFIAEINERIDSAIKWGCNAIADRNDEIKTRAEQAVATFCEASLTAKKMPTIDAEPVVRCKECKHLVRSEGVCKVLSNNYEPPVYVGDDGYCSRGERREDD